MNFPLPEDDFPRIATIPATHDTSAILDAVYGESWRLDIPSGVLTSDIGIGSKRLGWYSGINFRICMIRTQAEGLFIEGYGNCKPSGGGETTRGYIYMHPEIPINEFIEAVEALNLKNIPVEAFDRIKAERVYESQKMWRENLFL